MRSLWIDILNGFRCYENNPKSMRIKIKERERNDDEKNAQRSIGEVFEGSSKVLQLPAQEDQKELDLVSVCSSNSYMVHSVLLFAYGWYLHCFYKLQGCGRYF